MPKQKWKQPRKRNTLRTARILQKKQMKYDRHQWYIDRKAGLHTGQCPI
jgi:hypothetical protein